MKHKTKNNIVCLVVICSLDLGMSLGTGKDVCVLRDTKTTQQESNINMFFALAQKKSSKINVLLDEIRIKKK